MEPRHGNGKLGRMPWQQPRVIALTATREGIPAQLIWSMAFVAAAYATIGMMTF